MIKLFPAAVLVVLASAQVLVVEAASGRPASPCRTVFAPKSGTPPPRPGDRDRPLVLAHYMPWYAAQPRSRVWGWHWTMDHFNPKKIVEGKKQIASHFYPLIGPYDSGDPHVLEYHLLAMKLAGIDGVIVDWYGLVDFNDYAVLHANTRRLVEQVRRLGMKLAVCYEDQVIPKLVAGGKLKAGERVSHAVSEIDWLAKHWFPLESYVRLDGRPILLSFGQAGLKNNEWSQVLAKLKMPVSYFSEHFRREGAVGGFDWPIPSKGIASINEFQAASRRWAHSIPVVYPRFVDIYKQAKLHESFGRIDDQRGATFRTTLGRALAARSKIVQIATWNDWGEGTVIEPSREFGYRDLEVIQASCRKSIGPSFRASPMDLRLPKRLYDRRQQASKPEQHRELDRVSGWLASGQYARARTVLAIE